jgi:hypothetical protein
MPDLFESEDEEGAPSPFADAADFRPDRPRIGRPRGARNKHSLAFEAYYAARGFKDPLVTAAEIVTTDPVALLAWLKQHDPKGSKKLNLVQVLKLQLEAGRDVAPYLHGKAPVKVTVEGEALPMLVINAKTNELAQSHRLLEGKALSIGKPEPSEIKDLEGEE